METQTNRTLIQMMQAWDPAVRMETQTNRTLIQMMQAWKCWIDLARGGQPLVDWHFMQLMRELVERGVLDDSWEYAVDLRYLDMEFRPPQAQAHLASPVQLVP